MQEVKQNTKEWHKWRQEGIGASEANIIMGQSKFMTIKQLWDLKVNGRRKEDDNKNNFAADKGHRLEPKNRAMHELETGLNFPDTLAVSEQHPILRASLDGYNKENNIVAEYKYVGEADFQTVMSGKMLDKYYPQVQQQLFVTGSPICHFRVMTEEKDIKGKAIKDKYKYTGLNLVYDKPYVEGKLLPALFSFWDSVTKKQELELSTEDIMQVNDIELKKMLTRYKNLKKALDNYAGQEKELKEGIFKLSLKHHNKIMCGDVKISQSKSADSTSFDYKKFEDENKDIASCWRKTTKGRITKKITFPS